MLLSSSTSKKTLPKQQFLVCNNSFKPDDVLHYCIVLLATQLQVGAVRHRKIQMHRDAICPTITEFVSTKPALIRGNYTQSAKAVSRSVREQLNGPRPSTRQALISWAPFSFTFPLRLRRRRHASGISCPTVALTPVLDTYVMTSSRCTVRCTRSRNIRRKDSSHHVHEHSVGHVHPARRKWRRHQRVARVHLGAVLSRDAGHRSACVAALGTVASALLWGLVLPHQTKSCDSIKGNVAHETVSRQPSGSGGGNLARACSLCGSQRSVVRQNCHSRNRTRRVKCSSMHLPRRT